MEKLTTNIVIIGAGASGMMAAHVAALSGKEIYLLDHNKEVGRKILITGGGRCNFTNTNSQPTDYVSHNPHFCKSALSRFSPLDFVAMLKKRKIKYFEKKMGQLFCKDSAEKINDLLLSLIEKPNIKLRLKQIDLEVERNEDGFNIFNKSIFLQTKVLIVATGGLTLPTIGSTDWGYILAKKFGHKIIPTKPALVPLKTSEFTELAGNSLIARISCNDHYVEEEVLFTHKGLSGPAILKISLFWNHGDPIIINWLPEISIGEKLEKTPGRNQLNSTLKKYLPKKFVDIFLKRISIAPTTNMASLSKEDHSNIIKEIHSMNITPSGTEGFKKAEVTKGGVDTSKISSKTMESQLIPGLYFIGEVLDVTGQLGGHNLQWCWASAHAAGKAQ